MLLHPLLVGGDRRYIRDGIDFGDVVAEVAVFIGFFGVLAGNAHIADPLAPLGILRQAQTVQIESRPAGGPVVPLADLGKIQTCKT